MPRKASKKWGDGRNTIMLPVRVLKEDKIAYPGTCRYKK